MNGSSTLVYMQCSRRAEENQIFQRRRIGTAASIKLFLITSDKVERLNFSLEKVGHPVKILQPSLFLIYYTIPSHWL